MAKISPATKRNLIIGSVLIVLVAGASLLQLTALTQAGLVSKLQSQGAQVAVQGTLDEPFFSAPSHAVMVNGQQVIVVEYSTPLQRWNDARQVSHDGKTIGSAFVSWVGSAHFYQSGRIIAVFIGDDPALKSLLASILGPQFAGE